MALIEGKRQLELVREKFLDKSIIPLRDEGEIIGTVYCIENLKNGKRYVGSTINFNRRVLEYIRIYLRPGGQTTNINDEMHKDGIENFRIFPLRHCDSELNLAYWEIFYIREFNTLVPNGYNISINTHSRVKRKLYPIGIKPTASNRRKRSRPIFAIDPINKVLYMCDSVSLFSEAVYPIRRDRVTHAANHKNKIGGYFIFYADLIDKSEKLKHKCDYYKRLLHEKVEGVFYDEHKMYEALVRSADLQWFKDEKFTIYSVQFDDNTKERYKVSRIT